MLPKPKSGKVNTVKHPLQVKHACRAKAMMESFAIEGEEEERNMRRSNNGFSGPGFKCFSTGFKIMRRQEKAPEKFAKRRDCLNFASVNPMIPLSMII